MTDAKMEPAPSGIERPAAAPAEPAAPPGAAPAEPAAPPGAAPPEEPSLAIAREGEWQNVAIALAASQATWSQPGRTMKGQDGNRHFMYAPLDAILEATLSAELARRGIAYMGAATPDRPGILRVEAWLIHGASGGVMRAISLYPCPPNPTSKQRGSAETYARRYMLTALLGVAPKGEDDDGDASSRRSAPRPQPAAQPAAKPAPKAKRLETPEGKALIRRASRTGGHVADIEIGHGPGEIVQAFFPDDGEDREIALTEELNGDDPERTRAYWRFETPAGGSND